MVSGFVLSLLPVAVLAFVVAGVLSALLVVQSRHRGSRLTRTGDLSAVQAAHDTPTPRLGGLAIFAAVLAGAGLAGGALGWLLVLSALPLFISGAVEDLGLPVAPAGRLGAAALSAALAVWLTGYWIGGTGLPGLDVLLRWSPLAVLITVVAIATISHAFNLIDGLNGLAGLTAVAAAAGLAMTAAALNDREIAGLALLLGGAVLGFLLFNYPFGRIFLGDGGAYSVGFLLAVLGIALAVRHPGVTPFAMLLLLFWPLADLTLAIWRRWRRRRPVSVPDRLHFHQLVMRALEIEVFGRRRRRLANPLATALMMPFIAAPVVAGVAFHDRPLEAALALGAFFALFFGTYALGMRWATRRNRGLPRRAVLAVR